MSEKYIFDQYCNLAERRVWDDELECIEELEYHSENFQILKIDHKSPLGFSNREFVEKFFSFKQGSKYFAFYTAVPIESLKNHYETEGVLADTIFGGMIVEPHPNEAEEKVLLTFFGQTDIKMDGYIANKVIRTFLPKGMTAWA